jgi:DNA invertase Pin-like site-specific DNA recombinase
MRRVAVYLRVSTTDQTCENQARDLREYVARRGWPEAREYVDHGVSGTKERRPALDRLMADVRARKVDVVVVAAFDRFARSTRHLIEALDTFQHYGVEFISLRESIDTGSPLGRAVFVIVGAIAELERGLIIERVRSGLRRARAQGRRLGRPPVPVAAEQIRRAVQQHGSLRRAAAALGCDPKTLRNRLAQA